MNALDFITADVERERRGDRSRWLAPLGLLLLPPLLGLLARRDLSGVLDPVNLGANLAAAAALASIPLIARASARGLGLRRAAKACAGVAALVLLLGMRRALGPERALLADRFAFHAIGCCGKGLVAGSLAGALVMAVWWRMTSLPSRGRRLLWAIAAGLAATVTLSFNCDSPDWRHITLGHFLPALLVALAATLAQRLLFARALRQRAPDLPPAIVHIDRL